MRSYVLASVAAVALSLPALAQQSQQSDQSQSGAQQRSQMNGSQSQGQNQSQASRNQASDRQPIQVDKLSESQIRELQQALNEKGFDAGKVDGQWGQSTRSAYKNFKESQGYAVGENELDPRAISALGLDESKFGNQPETTGQGQGGRN
jgi:peptidoglycan hydrolase-like protein with peptidoglycan-binding domain